MPIRDEFHDSPASFLADFDPSSASGLAGEALLAIAVGAYSDEQRKTAKALLKKAKQARLTAALKALPRRNYWLSRDTLRGDLEALQASGDLNVPQLAFHIHQLRASRITPPFFADQIPAEYVRKELEAAVAKHAGEHLRFHETPWPAAVLLPLILEHPGLETLSFALLDPAALPDLRAFTKLTGLFITGPLTAIAADALRGVPLEYVSLDDTELTSIAGLAASPALKGLTYRRGPLADLPELGSWPDLEKLEIEECPLREVPASIGACQSLAVINLSDLPLKTLPAALAELPLRELRLFNLALEELPAWPNAQAPEYVSTYGSTLPQRMSAGAGRFLKMPSTAVLAEALEVHVRAFAARPRFAAALAAYAADGDARAAKLPELLVATSRVYNDDEHGPSTNTWLASVIEEKGGPIERAANAAARKGQVRTTKAIASIVAAVRAVEGFDADAFEAFALEGLGASGGARARARGRSSPRERAAAPPNARRPLHLNDEAASPHARPWGSLAPMGTGPDDRRPPPDAGDDEAGRSRAGAPIVVLSRPVSAPHPLPAISEARMVDALARIPLFEGLIPLQLARLAKIADERLYGAGEAIFTVGDPSEGLFVVLEGTVKITRTIAEVGEETLAVLRTGQHFGEMSLIDDAATRSANATAHNRVRALLLPRRDLRDLMFVDRELAHDLLWRFVHLLTRRVREGNDRLAMLSSSSRF